ncbi:hypothetical protein ACM66T_10250 [Sulfurimonas sp. ST-25]|uniref:hypothetical protein n=1 Tax=Sulfurimonas sp. ST-25 TaxID=3400151 RepID=UPI003A85C79F
MTLLVPKDFNLLASSAIDDKYPAWDSLQTYALNNMVMYNRYYYKCVEATPSSSTWANNIQYAKGDRVDYSSVTYVMISDYIKLPRPDVDARYTQQTYTIWNDTTAYSVGDIVLKDSWYPSFRQLYRCVQSNTGQPLTDTNYWEPATLWVDSVFYPLNAFVTLGTGPGVPYVVNTAITADAPNTDATNWAVPTPEYDTVSWLKTGPANSLMMFDSQNTTKTYGSGDLSVGIGGYEIDGLFFSNLEADSITIEVYDSVTEELIESHTEDLTFEPENWLDYFMGTWMAKSMVSYTYWRTSIVRDVVIAVTIENGGDDAACGVMIIGEAKPIAVSIWDVRRGGVDYTVVTQNTDGSSTATETAVYLPLIDIDSIVDTDATARVIADLEAVRNTPIAIIGDESDTYEAVNIFGVISSFGVTLQGPSKSTVSLEVTGLY